MDTKTEATRQAHYGTWRKLKNQAADAKGSIHDDEAARKAGFEGAFVPGSTVGTAAMPAVFAWYGPRWMEGGWYEFKFVSPVYEHDIVREVAEPMAETEDISLRIETQKGRLCCSGRAGLGLALPWEPSQDGTAGPEGVLPDFAIGLTYDQVELTVPRESVASMLEAAGEDSPWYRDESPWGGPVVPPEWLMGFALRMRPPRRLRYDGVRSPGMWSAHWLALREPLMLERSYAMASRVADKGRSGRSIFLTHEFTVRDKQGADAAVGRHQIKWFAAE